MKRIGNHLIALSSVLVIILLIASPILAYLYSATYTVTNNSTTTAYTMLPVMVTVDNTYLAANGFIKSTALDTRIETVGGAVKPHLVADNKTLTAIPAPVSSQTNLRFTTGNSDLTSMDIITGRNGYITIADAPALEPGAAFQIDVDGYFDAAATSEVVDKRVLRLQVVGTNVTGTIYGAYTVGANTTLIPDGAGAATGIAGAVPGGSTHWQDVDDPVAAPDDAVTFVFAGGATEEVDYYTVSAPAFLEDRQIITGVDVYTRHYREAANTGTIRSYLRRSDGTEASGTLVNMVNAWTTTSESFLNNRPGGGSWQTSDFADLQVMIGVSTSNPANYAGSTQVYVVVTYDHAPIASTVTSPITSGEHVVRQSYDGANHDLYIDNMGAAVDTDAWVGAVADVATDWQLMSNAAPLTNATPYWNSYEYYIGGALTVWYEPVTIVNGTVLPDRQGAAQDGVITWGTNPATVNVAIGRLVSSGQSDISDPTTTTRDILGEAEVSDWFREPDVSGTLATHPLRPFVTILSDTTSLTERQAWIWLALAVVLGGTVLVGSKVKGHHIITGVTCGVLIGLMVQQTIFPFYAVTFIIVAILAGVMAERKRQI